MNLNFRDWLIEMAMANPDTLDREKFVVVDIRPGSRVSIDLYKRKNLSKKVGSCVLVQCPKGTSYWTCHQAVESWYVGAGYGPFLYDLAIEYATMNGKGLVPAVGLGCGKNSELSSNVWRKYYEKRSDVKKTPLQTPETEDQETRPWLYVIYNKPPVFWNQLKEAGRLHVVGHDHPLAPLIDTSHQKQIDRLQRKGDDRLMKMHQRMARDVAVSKSISGAA